MKPNYLLTTLLLLFGAICSGLAASLSDQLSYIERYKQIAILEMQRFGIPASIKLAQGLIESEAGKSDLAVNAFNHFGIKCKSDWQGNTYKKVDDDKDKAGNLVESCFRAYSSVWESYRNHSEFLTTNARYSELFTYGMDYRRWAEGLQKFTYATNPRYAELLIKTIEALELQKYDMPQVRVNAEEIAKATKTDSDAPTTAYVVPDTWSTQAQLRQYTENILGNDATDLANPNTLAAGPKFSSLASVTVTRLEDDGRAGFSIAGLSSIGQEALIRPMRRR
jgi:hypothetical protein